MTGLAGTASVASAVSPANIWAIGGKTVADDAVVHYNGNAWSYITSSAFAGIGQFGAVLAESAGNIWLTGSNDHNMEYLFHGDGRRWTKISFRQNVSYIRDIVPDGQGGVWMRGVSGRQLVTLHRTQAGRWTSFAFHLTDGPGELGLIPGTTSLFGAGFKATVRGADAVVWGYGPAA